MYSRYRLSKELKKTPDMGAFCNFVVWKYVFAFFFISYCDQYHAIFNPTIRRISNIKFGQWLSYMEALEYNMGFLFIHNTSLTKVEQFIIIVIHSITKKILMLLVMTDMLDKITCYISLLIKIRCMCYIIMAYFQRKRDAILFVTKFDEKPNLVWQLGKWTLSHDKCSHYTCVI